MARSTLTLTGASSNYSGGTFVNGGVLSFKGANALGQRRRHLASPGPEFKKHADADAGQ